MKTPIKYWGGKQQISSRIMQLMPPHHCYVEPFFGGGAVFFAKEPSKVEIINDINDNMVNFYKVVVRHFSDLKSEIDVTLYSEFQYKEAKELWLKGSDNNVMRAWAVFVLSHQSFSGNIGNSWAHSDTRNMARQFDNVKSYFDERYVNRLRGVQIFCRDALKVIKACDSADTFHFIDPPYFNSDMGCYDGYTEQDLCNLLELLSTLKGKWLLTTYPSDLLAEYTARNGWYTINNKMHLSASNQTGKTKTEVFTMNYELSGQLNLF
jgi:DNA adenine methylase